MSSELTAHQIAGRYSDISTRRGPAELQTLLSQNQTALNSTQSMLHQAQMRAEKHAEQVARLVAEKDDALSRLRVQEQKNRLLVDELQRRVEGQA